MPGPNDPPWFRLELFPGATLTTSGRTPPNEQGLYATQMLFALAPGTTTQACLETLTTALEPTIPSLAREEGKDGRVTLRGSNADYEVTMICGEAKGKMSAYVAYRWLKAPPSSPSSPSAPAPTSPAPSSSAPPSLPTSTSP